MRYTAGLWRVSLSAVLCLTLASSPAYAVFQAYVKIKGIKQGQITGQGIREGNNQWIPVVAISHEVQSPRDNSTGMASGKRQHKPIKFTIELGTASFQLERARATNELLESVVIEFVRPGSRGKEEVYQTIELTNAQITAIQRGENHGAAGKGAEGKDTHETEEISLTFEKIEVTNDKGAKTATDDWLNPR
jgi:type VI secretion system secreted protein Hcp